MSLPHENGLSPRREALLLTGFGLILYWLMYGRRIFLPEVIISAETEQLWSAGYYFAYSLRHWGEIAWWDPTAQNGWPSYFLTLSGWFNYLGPVHALSWGIDLLICRPLGISINGFLEFQKTLYVTGLCLLAIAMLGRELIRNPWLRALPIIIFVLGQFPFQGFLASSLLESLPPPLFFLWGVFHFLKHGTVPALLRLVFVTALLAGSIAYSTLQSAFYWVGVPLVALLILRPRLILDVGRAVRAAWGDWPTRLALLTGGAAIIAGFAAFLLTVTPHLGNYTRATGQPGFDYTSGATATWNEHTTGTQEIVIYTAEGRKVIQAPATPWVIRTWPGWVGLLAWAPFADIHDKVLTFDLVGATVDHRYVGLITLPGLILGLLFAARDRRLAALIFAFIVCYVVIPYTVNHLLFRNLIESSFIFQNIRTLANTMPREGPSLFLALVAAMGIDQALLAARRGGRRWTADRLLALGGMLIAGGGFGVVLLLVAAGKAPAIRHSLSHIGIYGALYCLLLAGLLLAPRRAALRRGGLALLLGLALADLSLSASDYWLRGRVWMNVTKESDRLPPRDAAIIPTRPGDRHWSGAFSGMIHQSFAGPYFGSRAWLTLVSRPYTLPLLVNLDAGRRNIIAYPRFGFAAGGRYIPHADIAGIDSWLLDKIPELDPACRPTVTAFGTAYGLAPGFGGVIERIEDRGETILIRGWAVDAENFLPPAQVAVLWNGQPIASAPTGRTRWDLFSAYHRAYVNAGFEITLPRPAGPGGVRVLALGKAGIARDLEAGPGVTLGPAPTTTAPRRLCPGTVPPLLVHSPDLARSDAPPPQDLIPEILEFSANRVRVAVTMPAAGLLVHWDQVDPFWRAEIDGQPAVIETVNFLHKALRLGAGRHEVLFSYDPAPARWGWTGYWLLLIGFVGLWALRPGIRPVRAGA